MSSSCGACSSSSSSNKKTARCAPTTCSCDVRGDFLCPGDPCALGGSHWFGVQCGDLLASFPWDHPGFGEQPKAHVRLGREPASRTG